MAWITAADLLEYAAATLKVDEADLPALWTTIADLAAEQSHGDLILAMGIRGYLVSVLDTWDKRETYNRTQGLFRLGSMGGGFGDYKAEFFEQFDLREMLKESGFVTVDGVPVAPGGSQIGGLAYGTVTANTEAKTTFGNIGRFRRRIDESGNYTS